MKVKPEKKYPTLGACGLDCGLCPRYHTRGSSRCPGCLGPDFFDKHPSCGIISCCVKNHGYEVCAECSDWPCEKFDPKIEEGGEYDSFITYQNVVKNMNRIRKIGLNKFIKEQQTRITLLEKMLNEFDDGRSKNLYCLAATLLPCKILERAVKNSINVNVKEKAKSLKKIIIEEAEKNKIELKLRKKSF